MASTKTIKGITIEIAGDTTKLGKALKDVDATSNDLAASLKYVDRLLDMDPGNTELIAEKQHILADAIDNTSERLETLHSVQDQIKRQYADGEIGQRAYLDFQAELMRTEKKLQNLRSENDRLEASLNDAGDEARDTAGDLDRLESSARDAADAGGDLGGSFDDLASGSLKGIAGLVTGAVTALVGAAESTEEYREEMAKLDVAYSTAKLSAEAADEAYRILYRTIGETDQSVEAAQQIALLAESTEDVVAWASLAPGVVATFGDALQPETFFEAANETLKLGEATGAYVQLLEGTGYSVEAFNEGLAACNTEQEKQQYMLGVTNALLGDAAAEYEERNKTVMESRDADAKLTESMSKLGEAFAPVITGAKNVGSSFVDFIVPGVEHGIAAFSTMGENASANWELVKDGFSMLGEGCVEIGNDIAAAFSDFTERSKARIDAFSDDWENFGAVMRDGALAIGADIKDFFGDAIETVRGLFDFEWEWPKLKMPHFSLEGEFSLNPPSVPKLSVSWYARGGILTSPTLFGFMGGSFLGGGEAGQEAVLPLDSFYSKLEDILTRRPANSQLIVNFEIAHFENHTEQDLDRLTETVGYKLYTMMEKGVASFA